MTQQVVVPNKRRRIVDQTVSGAGSVPTFPAAGSATSPVQFLGDFTGARIAGIEVRTGTFVTLTSLGVKIEQSQDGTNWHDWLTLSNMATGTKQVKMLDSADDQPMRYLKATFSAAGGSFGTAPNTIVDILYNQFGAKGRFAPPGFTDLRS